MLQYTDQKTKTMGRTSLYILAAASASLAFITTASLRSSSITPEGLLGSASTPHKDSYSITKSSDESDIKNYARAFYTSPLFKIERLILKYGLGYSITDEQILNTDFNIGDKVLLWEVVGRTKDEVMLRFKHNDFSGLTWMKIEEDKLKFGSGLDDATSISLKLSLAFHYLYSRMLIYTTDKFLSYKTK